MNIKKLFAEHIKLRVQSYERILSNFDLDGIVISSGYPHRYFADDQDAPFRPTPHFSHWTPFSGANSLLVIQSGQKPKLLQFKPQDFWHDQEGSSEEFWQEHFNIVECDDREKVWNEVKGLNRFAFIGPETAKAKEYSFLVDHKTLLAHLDWERGVKSDYEIFNITEANKIASLGHVKARDRFREGASELEIHLAYLDAVKSCEADLPYGSIIGMNNKSAVLHYQYKRHPVAKGHTMLIDAGVAVRKYASDITRTYCKSDVHAVFKDLLTGMEHMQKELCQLVHSGVCFSKLHEQCHRKTSDLLQKHNLLYVSDSDEAIRKGLTKVFFPHGLGHMLGLQVHDVSGLQKNANGDPCDPNDLFPKLRTARELREKEVITIEPGLYFIEMLLNPHRTGECSSLFNWNLIDQLLPYGGIRIEDNILVEKDHGINLTNQFLSYDVFV